MSQSLIALLDCLLSLSKMHVRFPHAFSCLRAQFFLSHRLIFHCLDVLQFIYPLTYWRTFCLQVLAIRTKGGIYIHIQPFVWARIFNSFEYILRCVIPGSYGKSMFSFLRNLQTDFQSGCIILHSHQQWMRVPVAPHHHQHLVLSLFWILIILIDVQWYLTVALICNSLKTSNVKHSFVCLIDICISSSVRCLFRSFAPF